MQPSTSYWPATISPGASLGANENGVPQCGQNPSTSPGCPSLPRPTGRSHAPQNRLFSATSGFASTAEAGSRAGTGGMSTRPAPRWPRDDLVLPARVRRLPEPLPVVPVPVPVVPVPVPVVPMPAPPGPEKVAGDGAEPAGATGWAGSGASPHVSQYPPSIVPPQPGRVHLITVLVMAVSPVHSGRAPPAGSR